MNDEINPIDTVFLNDLKLRRVQARCACTSVYLRLNGGDSELWEGNPFTPSNGKVLF